METDRVLKGEAEKNVMILVVLRGQFSKERLRMIGSEVCVQM